MLSIHINARHRDWLKSASPAQRDGWLSKGPLELGEFLSDPTSPNRKETFRPFIRGVMVGSYHDDPNKAMAEGNDLLNEIKARNLEFVDEDALGIGTANQTIVEVMDEATISFETILHLGAICATGGETTIDSFDEFMQDFNEQHVKALKNTLPFVEEFFKSVESEGDWDDTEENGSAFLEYARRAGCLGFLVQVSHPVMDFVKNGKSASFSWGHRSLTWVYGESLLEVANKASEWADQQDSEAKKRAKNKAS